MKWTRVLFITGVLLIATAFFSSFSARSNSITRTPSSWWEFQSIDTMKYSRDPSREKLHDPAFDQVITTQVRNIADTGATHVGIATPYDEEFIPILKRWIAAARQHKLHVWFRGNWSGWEKWFGYESITREQHIAKTQNFILTHKDLFEDGDVFSGCPECENGGPGNPQITGDARGYREFLINEYAVTKAAFAQIGKQVASNYFSMNGDVAKLIMDRPTTKALGGIVTIDHYVGSPDRLVSDIRAIAAQSGGRVVLGEFGAPIPDIHGDMDEETQASYLNETMNKLSGVNELVGVNYWVNVGGSTRLWNDDESPRKAVQVIKNIFRPATAYGSVKNEIGKPITNASVRVGYKAVLTDSYGNFTIPRLPLDTHVYVTAQDYVGAEYTIKNEEEPSNIILSKVNESRMFNFLKTMRKIFNFLP